MKTARVNGHPDVGIYVAHDDPKNPSASYAEKRFLIASRHEDAPDWPATARAVIAYADKAPEGAVVYYVDCSGAIGSAERRTLLALSKFSDDHIQAIENKGRLSQM